MSTATTSVTLNHDQRLYVIPSGNGYTCLGFDVCREQAGRLAEWLGTSKPAPDATPEQVWEAHALLIKAAGARCLLSGGKCGVELTPQLVGLEGKRVEVVDCDGTTRQFYVGKSTGWMPVHLEIKTRQSHGGMAAYSTPYRSVRVVGET